MTVTTYIILILAFLANPCLAWRDGCSCGSDVKGRIVKMYCNEITNLSEQTSCGGEEGAVRIAYIKVKRNSSFTVSEGIMNRFTSLENLNIEALGRTRTQLSIPPDAFSQASRLKEMDIIRFIVTDTTLKSFASAPRLRELHLRWCKMNVANQSVFGELGNLTSLTLENARNLDRIAPDGIPNMLNLETLIISSVDTISLPANFGRNLSKLTRLHLYGTNSASIARGTLAGLPNLLYLSVSRSNVRTIEPGVFDRMKNLTGLNLAKNNIASLPADLFGEELTQLLQLDLSENKLTTLPSGVFDRLKSLAKLNLRRNAISRLPDGLFSNTKVGEINLESNQLRIITSGMFRGAKSVTDLKLSCNNISTIESHAFDDFARLKDLRMVGMPLETVPHDLFANVNCSTVYVSRGIIPNITTCGRKDDDPWDDDSRCARGRYSTKSSSEED